MDLWVAFMVEEDRDLVSCEEQTLGAYSSEELALEVANLASSPEKGRVKHYVLDHVPDWIENWLAEIAEHEEAESTELNEEPGHAETPTPAKAPAT